MPVPLDNSSVLLIPGPVSLPLSTRLTMLEDHAAREREMVEGLRYVRRYLVKLANAEGIGTAIPLPGSATYANEAMIRTFVPKTGKLLLHTNGGFGEWLVEMCVSMGVPHVALRTPPTRPPSIEQFREALRSNPDVTHVIVVHVETSSGLLNPIRDIADLCYEQGKALLIDAVASFGVLELDMRRLRYQALTLSSNKCLEGPPGLGWVVANAAALEECKGNARSLSLDLWEQNRVMEQTGFFRFTPPIHAVRGTIKAVETHEAEGGTKARLRRYRTNWWRLVSDMRRLGFETLLADDDAAPILATFHDPADANFDIGILADEMAAKGIIIFPGRLAVPNTFRIGCIGAIEEATIRRAVKMIAETLARMGVQRFGRSATFSTGELPQAFDILDHFGRARASR
jgi:2-aminoethylphosphonate-pyruvate transaminase